MGARPGVVGRSWAGYLVLRALTSENNPFSCGWAGAAIADWEIQQAETEVRYYDRQLLGGYLNEPGIRDLARERSPIHDVDRISVPLLLTHGRDDRDVPFRQIEHFAAARRRAGGLLEEPLFFDGEGHSCKNPSNAVRECEAILGFLNRHLKPWVLDSNPCGRQTVY